MTQNNLTPEQFLNERIRSPQFPEQGKLISIIIPESIDRRDEASDAWGTWSHHTHHRSDQNWEKLVLNAESLFEEITGFSIQEIFEAKESRQAELDAEYGIE